uniref:hypothetical protein n=1 Tax=Escherichia coli TaxID=562 RepID=UPI0026CB4656
MILTLNDKREISQIIASFTDEDYERINSEVDRLCKRCDPISEMLRSYKPDEHTKDAIDWLEDDDWVIPPFFGALKSRGHAACAKRCFGV